MSLGFNAGAALNIHANTQACGWSPTSGEPTCVCDGARLQCVKHPCVCRGSLQLCRRPCIMHASILLHQLWSQPWAEAGALSHADAHFFKGGLRNPVEVGETMNRVKGIGEALQLNVERLKKAACACLPHLTDFKLHESSHSCRWGGAAPCGEGLVRLTQVYLRLSLYSWEKEPKNNISSREDEKRNRKHEHPKSCTDLMRHSVI